MLKLSIMSVVEDEDTKLPEWVVLSCGAATVLMTKLTGSPPHVIMISTDGAS